MSDLSQSVTPTAGQLRLWAAPEPTPIEPDPGPERPCYRCQVEETHAPCAPCPLYPAWLARVGLADDAVCRETYRSWVGAGGWTARWRVNTARIRAAEADRVADVLARYPRVRRRWPNYPSVRGEPS